jgi:hypothetical protein
MKTIIHLTTLAVLIGPCLILSGCSSPEVQDARASGLDNRHDRIDSRTSARQDRWRERGEREDSRSEARFNSW